MKFSVMLLAALLAAWAHAAPDYARERRWADEITPALVVGDAVYLTQKSGHRLLALYNAPPQARAAVITVHGLGVHPDWALIGALRTKLADQSYATLSVQMPVLAADAKADAYAPLLPDAAERLAAAVAFLKAKGHRNIAMACHSFGAQMCNFFLANTLDHGIAAWVAIGITPGEYIDAGKLKLPVLDIYGERDFPQVLQHAESRAAVLKKLKGSAQIEVAGADHFFTGYETELVRQIKRFLDLRLK